MKHHTDCGLLMDSTDLGTTRKTRKLSQGEKADVLDSFIAIISILTFLADIGTDILAAHQYFVKSHWSWFGLTVLFIVIPSIVMQSLSCKWYFDDYGKQPWWSKLLHICQLGPIQRYSQAFWSGLRTNCMTKIDMEDFNDYLTNWRDVTMLRLIEAFLESAPQVVLQLYILSVVDHEIQWDKDWITILSVLLSITSLGWSIVSYTHALRLSAKDKGLSVCGYTFQVTYRLCMVASRVVALVLFATQFEWVVFVVCFVHWIVMICWLHFQGTKFCSSPNTPDRSEAVEKCLDRLFSVLMGFIHIFCFINTQEGATRQRVMTYYVLIFVENTLMIAAWYPTRRNSFGWLEYSAASFVLGGFLLGLISMLIYYKLFHPNQDITAGWFCCVMCSKDDSQTESIFTSSTSENCSRKNTDSPTSMYRVSISVTPKPGRRFIKKSDHLIPIDIEFSSRGDRSPGKTRRNNEQVYQIAESGQLEERKEDCCGDNNISNGIAEKEDVNRNSYGSLDVPHRRHISGNGKKSEFVSSFDQSGLITKIVI